MISREEFYRLDEELTEYAIELREKDRHERGGTSLGQMAEDGSLADGMIAYLFSEEYIREEVPRILRRHLGE